MVNIRISSFSLFCSFSSIFHFFKRDLSHSYSEMKEKTLDEYQSLSSFAISVDRTFICPKSRGSLRLISICRTLYSVFRNSHKSKPENRKIHQQRNRLSIAG